MKERNHRLFAWLCLALGLATLVVFARLVQCGFINFDDPEYVTENTHVRSGLSLANIVWALTASHADNWHPLTWMSHMLDCQVYGLRAGGHHATNVLLHAANALLLFGLLRRMTGSLWRSAFVAALFALHPLRVESVAWISERKDVLAALFWLLTMWAYVRFVECGKPAAVKSANSRRGFYALALIFFALGLMAKPMLVTLPFALLLMDYWPLGRAEKLAPALLVEKAPFFALSAIVSVITFEVQRRGGAVVNARNLPVTDRVANAAISCWRYLGKFFWPADLSVFYPRPAHWPAGLAVLAIAGLLGVTAVVIVLRKRQPWLPVGWFWYLGTLVPVIGLVQVGDQSMADRYTYIPMIGVLLMLAWGVAEWFRASGLLRWSKETDPAPDAIVFAAAALLVICAALTCRQTGYWTDTQTLFHHALDVTRGNYVAYWHLADDYAARGGVVNALEMYGRTIEIAPGCFQARNNFGKLLLARGRVAEAAEQFEKVIALQPGHAHAHNNLGIALYRQGHAPEAVREFQEALQLKTDYAEARNNLATLLLEAGRVDEAIAQLEAGTALDPADADAQFNLAAAFEKQGRLDEAIARFRTAVQLQPNQADAHNSLGAALGKSGRSDEAIAQFREAIRLDPKLAVAYCNLGTMLSSAGNREEAAAQFTRALALQPGYTEAAERLRNLSNAPAPQAPSAR